MVPAHLELRRHACDRREAYLAARARQRASSRLARFRGTPRYLPRRPGLPHPPLPRGRQPDPAVEAQRPQTLDALLAHAPSAEDRSPRRPFGEDRPFRGGSAASILGGGHCSGTAALRMPSRMGSSWERYVGSSLIAAQVAWKRLTVKVALRARPVLVTERASSRRPSCARAAPNTK